MPNETVGQVWPRWMKPDTCAASQKTNVQDDSCWHSPGDTRAGDHGAAVWQFDRATLSALKETLVAAESASR